MKKDNIPAVRLNNDEFAIALQKGLGRAFQYIACCGLDDVLNVFIEGCIHSQKWDDSSLLRSKWLFSMFKDTPHYDSISQAILNATSIQTNTDDLQQLVSLCQEMSLHGDQRALPAIEKLALEKASNPSYDDWLGAEEYINLTGVKGGLELARLYGKRLLNNTEDTLPETLFRYNPIKDELQHALLLSAQTDDALEAYWKYLESKKLPEDDSPPEVEIETRKARFRANMHEGNTLYGILRAARNHEGKYPGQYMAFGRCASDEELEEVYSALVSETDTDTQVRLLWVFRRAKLPRLNNQILVWADNENEELKNAAITALSHTTDPGIHQLAQRKVKQHDLVGANWTSLELFTNNFETSDAALITKALASIHPNKEEAHVLAWSIADIANKQKDKSLVKALIWAYENTPCSNCRAGRIVPMLDELSGLTGDILYECQFDAEEEIQILARKRLAAL